MKRPNSVSLEPLPDYEYHAGCSFRIIANKAVSMSRRTISNVRILSFGLVSCLLASLTGADADAQTLKRIKERGSIVCGVNPDLFGFSKRDEIGVWSGFDVDFCRALAAAIFDDARKVQYVPLEN